MGILDKIAEIEREIARTQKNKGMYDDDRSLRSVNEVAIRLIEKKQGYKVENINCCLFLPHSH